MDQEQQQRQQPQHQQLDQSSSSSSYEQLLRSEVSRGCSQVRQFEQKLQSLIQSPAFYPTLIVDAASIISTFANIITQLNRGDTKQQAIATAAAAVPVPGIRPSINPALLTPASSSPMMCSPIRAPTPPHSPPNLSLSSPHTTSSSSPALTPCATPEGSPNNPTSAAMDGAAAADTASGGAAMDDFPGSGIGRKRKCLPKRVVKIPANSNEHGNESPADDGFTWRKYGQKDILNSKFPRSYYRCTHQKELGCQATKYVQKCEDEPSMYQVTYIGDHSCQNALNATTFWMRSGLSARPLHDSPFSAPPSQSATSVTAIAAAAAAAVGLTHPSSGIHFTAAAAPSLTSRPDDGKTSRLTLSSPQRPASGFNLLRPTATLTSPSQWITPKFGALPCPAVKSEPVAVATTTSPPSSLDTDQRLLKMTLGSSSGGSGGTGMLSSIPLSSSSSSRRAAAVAAAAPASASSSVLTAATLVGVASASGEQENIQGLWNIGDIPEVGMDTDAAKSSSSLTDLAYIGDVMGYDQSMLFESDD